jgi:ubiquinone/menaquinone biosynthesis C-methylase UbiE
MNMADKQTKQNATGQLFGNLFSAYDDKAYVASMELFSRRFEENGFPLNWFKGKRCLDVGCGGGRYSLSMAVLGAKEVTGIDISEGGVRDAQKRAAGMHIENVQFKVGSAEQLPFEANSFDAVIFSGVLQHTAEPCKVLDEVCRVVSPCGMLYLLVYATEGLRWPLVQMLRPIAQMTGFDFMDEAVALAGLAVNQRRTYLDDLFVPYIDFYSWPGLRGMLKERGFEKIERWSRGRLDHEENIETYRKDLLGFLDVFTAAITLASERKHRELEIFRNAERIIKAVLNYVDGVRNIKSDWLDEKTVRELTIGQGHHRVIAWKESK